MNTGNGRMAALVLSLAFLLDPPLRAESLAMDRLVVSASPVGSQLGESLQSVSVITRAEIESAPAATVAELLARVAGVDVRRRGGAGVQADVGIRGTAYEQTVLLINGVPLKDPQTGHHDLNIPVPLEQIERIEVVRGPGGVAYGGNATGGLINIVTRQAEGTEYGAGARAGRFSTREIRGHAGHGDGRGGHLLSASWLDSDGHLPESRSDSDLRQALYTGHRHFDGLSLDWGLGVDDKAFGAWKFYTADFPDQREETTSRLAWVAGRARQGEWDIAPRVFWRQHDDWFRTLVGETAFINEHETDLHGLRVDAGRDLGGGRFAFGGGLLRQRIESNALSDHRRDEATLWAAHRQPLGPRVSVEVGLNAVRFSDLDSELLPSLGLGYRFSPAWRGFVSSARSARAPSWTELFLLTGGNVGNPDLAAERSTYHEAGLRFSEGEHRAGMALFERRTDELIDWARAVGAVTWQADNFDGHRTRGAEIEWRWIPARLPAVHYLSTAWTTLSTRLDDRGQEIKYALDYPRHALNASGRFGLVAGLELALDARRIERASGDRATLVSARLQRRFDALALYLEGSNLLDEEVVEAGFAPLPGRALFVGLDWRRR